MVDSRRGGTSLWKIVTTERVFSGAKHTISDHRASLKSETIELLECLKSWYRLGIFMEVDLHAIVGTMEEGGANALDLLA